MASEAPNFPSYRSSGQVVFFRYRADGAAAGTAVAAGQRARISPQGYFYAGPLSVIAEYTISSQEMRRDTTAAKISHQAWQVSAAVFLTGGKNSFRGASPKTSFDPANRKWGAVELAARLHALDFDEEAFPVFANPVSSARKALAWAVGVNWYLNQHAKFAINFEQTSFDGGALNSDRAAEKIFLSRFQIAY